MQSQDGLIFYLPLLLSFNLTFISVPMLILFPYPASISFNDSDQSFWWPKPDSFYRLRKMLRSRCQKQLLEWEHYLCYVYALLKMFSTSMEINNWLYPDLLHVTTLNEIIHINIFLRVSLQCHKTHACC